MSNTEKQIRKFTTNCISCLPVVYIARPSDNNGVQVVMLGISEEQEKQLDNGEIITITTDRGTFNIEPELCYAYGEVDFSPNGDSIRKIYKAKWFDDLEIIHYLPNVYDYETHTVTSEIRGGTQYSSRDLRDYLPYLHGCIGKPKRVAIFKEYTRNILENKKKKIAKTKAEIDSRYYNATKIYKQEQNRAKTVAKRKARVKNLTFKIKK